MGEEAGDPGRQSAAGGPRVGPSGARLRQGTGRGLVDAGLRGPPSVRWIAPSQLFGDRLGEPKPVPPIYPL